MKKKLRYFIPLLLLMLIMLGPAIYKGLNPVSPDVSGSVAYPSAPVFDFSGETQKVAPIPSATSDINSTKIEGASVTIPVFSPESVKDPLPTPAESTVSETVQVNIAVMGKNRELLYGPGTVKLLKNNPQGTTALGALEATGLPYDISKRFTDFVEAVAGLRNNGQSGWLYKVNDEVPLVAADKKPVTSNDRVIWWYSSSINETPPSWEELNR